MNILVYFVISALAMQFLTPYSFMLSLQKDTKSAKVRKLFAQMHLILLPTKHPASDGRTERQQQLAFLFFQPKLQSFVTSSK